MNDVSRESQPPDRNETHNSLCGADSGVLPTLLRYRDRHQWSWNLSMRLINLYYGTDYTEKQLKAMYKTHGA